LLAFLNSTAHKQSGPIGAPLSPTYIDLNERWSWNVITYRYRDAFDPANNYNTPEVSTGITLKIDGNNSIYVKYLYDWHDGPPSAQAFAFGYKYRF